MVHTHKKHYIGNVSASNFYYKDAIFVYYNMAILYTFLPSEIIDYILSYICSSLVVFATNKTLHYINPKDNATIKSIPLNKIRDLNSANNTFAISEDGLTFYRIYRRHIELEYLCDEVPDPNKTRNKKTIDSNRYYYSYNITKKCKISTPIYKYGPMYGNFGDKICLSSYGKYIAKCASKENVIDKSSSYIAIYEAKTKTFIKEIKVDAEEIQDLSLSPDNNIIMAITSRVENKQTIWMWDTNSGKIILEKQLRENMFFNTLDHQIKWNEDSSNFAISIRLNHENILNAPVNENGEHIIDSAIIIGSAMEL